MAKYRAVRDSYGFRGRHWISGDIAHDVKEDEQIPDHFEPVPEDVAEKSKDESFEPPEPTTLSEWQKRGQESVPAPGLEKPKPAPKHEVKAEAHPQKPKAHETPHAAPKAKRK